MALTGKKAVFAEAVLAGKSNREAAVMAGYSTKTASAAGSRLAKDRAILEYLTRQAREMGKAEANAESQPAPPLSPASFELSPSTPIVWSDPLAFLRAVMNHKFTDLKHRIDAAKAMMPYEYAKKSDIGKKEEREQFSLVAEQGTDWDRLLQ